MLTIKTINSKNWAAITTAGQEGSAWVVENKRGNGRILISHATSDLSKPDSRHGLLIKMPNGNNDIMVLGPDGSKDIFYARCLKANSIVKIAVDVI